MTTLPHHTNVCIKVLEFTILPTVTSFSSHVFKTFAIVTVPHNCTSHLLLNEY